MSSKAVVHLCPISNAERDSNHHDGTSMVSSDTSKLSCRIHITLHLLAEGTGNLRTDVMSVFPKLYPLLGCAWYGVGSMGAVVN